MDQDKPHIMHLTKDEVRWVVGMDEIKRSHQVREEILQQDYDQIAAENRAMQSVVDEIIVVLRISGIEVESRGNVLMGPVEGHFRILGMWFRRDELLEAIKNLIIRPEANGTTE